MELQHAPPVQLVRSGWAAAATLGHRRGTTLSAIFILAETKAAAISAAVGAAAQNLPDGTGDEYSVIVAHATRLDTAVIRAALEELEPAEQKARPC